MSSLYENLIRPIDFIIGPILLFILYTRVNKYREKHYAKTPYFDYYMLGFKLRILGFFLTACMVQLYYHGGDTFDYHLGAIAIWNLFWDNPSQLFEVLTTDAGKLSFEISKYFVNTNTYEYTTSENNFMVVKIGGIIGLFTFNSYIGIGLILVYFSFRGCWLLFLTFVQLYPKLHKEIAISTLYMPSVFFWGAAGLMKDTITMACIGFMTYSAFEVFLKGKIKILLILRFLFCFYLAFIIKPYIIISFLPAIFIWIFFSYESKIRNKYLRLLTRPIFVTVAIVAVWGLYQVLSAGSNRYSQKDLLKYVHGIHTDHGNLERVGVESAYNLGEVTLTPMGILSKVPAAINVALFRPYLWEIRKPLLLPSALEGMACLIFTIFIFLKVGIKRTFQFLFSDPNVLFCLTFSIIFAFAVGFTTYNFGALSRLKIPCIPFYFLALFIMYEKSKNVKSKIFKKF
jgi:hypothetical protein